MHGCLLIPLSDTLFGAINCCFVTIWLLLPSIGLSSAIGPGLRQPTTVIAAVTLFSFFIVK